MIHSVQLEQGENIEIICPDGSALRLRWNAAERGIKLTAETRDGRFATGLVVRPRGANGVVIAVE